MSQSTEILRYMKRNSITPVEALSNIGCFRLAARIKNLRDMGHNIRTSMVCQNGKRFARYTLQK